MPDSEVYYVTEPIEFAFDNEGNIECTIRSKKRTFIFAISRHKCRNANMAMRIMLDEAVREQGKLHDIRRGKG